MEGNPLSFAISDETTLDTQQIILEDRGEAELVLEKLRSLVDLWAIATVADLYELVGITGHFSDVKRGWTDLSGASIKRVTEGYLLDLPLSEPTNDEVDDDEVDIKQMEALQAMALKAAIATGTTYEIALEALERMTVAFADAADQVRESASAIAAFSGTFSKPQSGISKNKQLLHKKAVARRRKRKRGGPK